MILFFYLSNSEICNFWESKIRFEIRLWEDTHELDIQAGASAEQESSLERVNTNIAFLTFVITNTTPNCQVFLSFFIHYLIKLLYKFLVIF